MSDHFEFEKFAKSLDVTAKPTAKEKARAAFFEKAEEVAGAAKAMSAVKAKRKSRKRAVLYFAAGMAAMLIMFVGIRAAYSPEFLTGTIASQQKQTIYRIFPSEMDTPALELSSPYTGELLILPKLGAGQTYMENLTPCDGSTLSMADHADLLTVLSGQFGLDWTARTFQIPSYSLNGETDGFQYFMITKGSYPYSKEDAQSIETDSFQFVPVDFSSYAANGEDDKNYYGLFLGEIVLVNITDKEAQLLNLIPCNGQTLKTADYPGLALMLGVTGETFRLPDLSAATPVEGATFNISAGGISPCGVGE